MENQAPVTPLTPVAEEEDSSFGVWGEAPASQATPAAKAAAAAVFGTSTHQQRPMHNAAAPTAAAAAANDPAPAATNRGRHPLLNMFPPDTEYFSTSVHAPNCIPRVSSEGALFPTGLCIMARKHSLKQGPTFMQPVVDSLECLATINISHPGSGHNHYNTLIMVVAATFHNETKIRILNTHFHHKPAKKMKGFCLAHDHIMEILAITIQQFNIHIVTGDFNQASGDISSLLSVRLGLPVYIIGKHIDDECIMVLCFQLPQYNDGNIACWQHLNGAHWPVAINLYLYIDIDIDIDICV